MEIHNIVLPGEISSFISGVSEFSTSRMMTKSGFEICSSDQQIVRRKYYIDECKISLESFENFNNFFLGRAGSRYGFLLKDQFDYKASNQLLFFKNDHKYNLQKIYPDLCNPYRRLIKYPDVDSIIISLNGTPYNNFNYDPHNAEIVIQDILNDHRLVKCNFEFMIPVRFTGDTYKYKFSEDGSIILQDIEMQEIII